MRLNVGGPGSAADMPGTGSKRRAAIRSRAVTLSPTGQTWAAATTEGLLLYSLDQGLVFDPTHLTEDITPAAAYKALGNRAFVRALLIALRLKDPDVLRHVIMSTPPNQVGVCVKPERYLLLLEKVVTVGYRNVWNVVLCQHEVTSEVNEPTDPLLRTHRLKWLAHAYRSAVWRLGCRLQLCLKSWWLWRLTWLTRLTWSSCCAGSDTSASSMARRCSMRKQLL